MGYEVILSNTYTKINQDEIEVYINGTKVEVLIDYYKDFTYKFDKGGIYVLDINIKKTLSSMELMFRDSHAFAISFLPGFDSSKVTSMQNMFMNNKRNIESIDMKYLDTSNIINLKFFNRKNTFLRKYGNLKEYIIDLSSFDTSKIKICSGMFIGLDEIIIIKISNKFTKCREEISLANKVINIDEIECQKYENCEQCMGSKETLRCSKCKIGYILNDDYFCDKSRCDIGENEKCLNCQTEEGNENKCLNCNEGYYLSKSDIDKTKCKKCQIEGCKSCDKYQGICDTCKEFYESIINNER